jgi:hypothetical protein
VREEVHLSDCESDRADVGATECGRWRG